MCQVPVGEKIVGVHMAKKLHFQAKDYQKQKSLYSSFFSFFWIEVKDVSFRILLC